MMFALGINIGSSHFKAVLCRGPEIIDTFLAPVYEHYEAPFIQWLQKFNIHDPIYIQGTGMNNGWRLTIPRLPESHLISYCTQKNAEKPKGILSLGGETLALFTLTEQGDVADCLTGSKCAVGTGEFLRQQLARMNMQLSDLQKLSLENPSHSISSRCSVFMKSDCTHRLNKGESTPHEIALLLCRMIAEHASQFIQRAHIHHGTLWITGGLSQVPAIRYFLEVLNPKLTFDVPDTACFFEAYAAAQLALKKTTDVLPVPLEAIFKNSETIHYPRTAPLSEALSLLDLREGNCAPIRPHTDYILGVDGGSTTTKVALVAVDNGDVVAVHYDRTLGDPVAALKRCLAVIEKQIQGHSIAIRYIGTTGSSRELLGVFTNASAVYNEIEAHAAGAEFFVPEADTIMEIGGQDAKFMQLHNGVPINYVMNEACSAGTGSFLEEAAAGDLGIRDCREIAPMALKAPFVLDFGEHCSAFINTDIRNALRQGAPRESVVAGMVASVVQNYRKRVVGQRTLGKHILLQGGVAKNIAVAAAFAQKIQQKITIPPFPELAGAIGVALLVRRKIHAGMMPPLNFDLETLRNSNIESLGTFRCKSCENQCEIRRIQCGESRFNFGGRCSQYARSTTEGNAPHGIDFVAKRNAIVFQEPDPPETSRGIVGLPRVLSATALFPFYAHFLTALGFTVYAPEKIVSKQSHRLESSYCFPVELAHVAVEELQNAGVDYIFIPMLQEVSQMVYSESGCSCPLTLSAPIYLPKAFPEIAPQKWLMPHLIFSDTPETLCTQLSDFAQQLNLTQKELREAIHAGLSAQKRVQEELQLLGMEALKAIETQEGVLLGGHPYNALSPDANLSIPKKLTSRGYHVIPYDILPAKELCPCNKELYWFHFQKALSAAVFARANPHLHLLWITNFSCAPDSFVLHYLQRFYGNRPYLVLELDSHSADAGVDTRIEAFLDIKSEYFSQKTVLKAPKELFSKKHISRKRGNQIAFGNHDFKKVLYHHDFEILITNPQQHEIEVFTKLSREAGMNFIPLQSCDAEALRFAKPFVSGKECLPAQLLLGSLLRFIASEQYDVNKNYLMFVPDTCGPCRTGQYKNFYANLLDQLGLPNVYLMNLHSDESYADFGKIFGLKIFTYVTLYDAFIQIRMSLAQLAQNPESAVETHYALLQKYFINPPNASLRNVQKHIRAYANEIARIPLKKIAVPTVVHIVGEFFVRLDHFSSDEIVQYLTHNGVDRVFIASANEWLSYMDFWRQHMLVREGKTRSWFQKLAPHYLCERLKLWAEIKLKRRMVLKIEHALAPCKHLMMEESDMQTLMNFSKRNFMPPEIGSEINISAASAAYMLTQKKAHGVIIISPFACLIGRSLEGILKPWAREHNVPVLALETDGNPQPPSALRSMDIFIYRTQKNAQNP